MQLYPVILILNKAFVIDWLIEFYHKLKLLFYSVHVAQAVHCGVQERANLVFDSRASGFMPQILIKLQKPLFNQCKADDPCFILVKEWFL